MFSLFFCLLSFSLVCAAQSHSHLLEHDILGEVRKHLESKMPELPLEAEVVLEDVDFDHLSERSSVIEDEDGASREKVDGEDATSLTLGPDGTPVKESGPTSLSDALNMNMGKLDSALTAADHLLASAHDHDRRASVGPSGSYRSRTSSRGLCVIFLF